MIACVQRRILFSVRIDGFLLLFSELAWPEFVVSITDAKSFLVRLNEEDKPRMISIKDNCNIQQASDVLQNSLMLFFALLVELEPS